MRDLHIVKTPIVPHWTRSATYTETDIHLLTYQTNCTYGLRHSRTLITLPVEHPTDCDVIEMRDFYYEKTPIVQHWTRSAT